MWMMLHRDGDSAKIWFVWFKTVLRRVHNKRITLLWNAEYANSDESTNCTSLYIRATHFQTSTSRKHCKSVTMTYALKSEVIF